MRPLVVSLVLALALVSAGTAAAQSNTSDAVAAAPWKKVATLRGSGSRVVSVKLPAGPVVFVATNRGSSNFVVQLSGPDGKDLLVNVIGAYSGASVPDALSAGKYRVVVDSSGSWVIQVLKPTTAGLKRLPGAFTGKGSTVVRVRSSGSGEMIVTGSHSGSSNFVVYLIGYGSVEGRELVFNEIGRYKGQDLIDIPGGTMLLWVTADGPWKVSFAK